MEKIEIRDLRKKEQFILDDAFLNGYAKYLGVYAISVYCSLCRHSNKDQTSWPSLDKIGEEIDAGRNSVIDSIKRMEFWGMVVKVRVGKMVNNRYILTDKKTWKPISEVCLKDYSDVCGINITSLLRKHHVFATQTSNSKEPQYKETQVRLSGAPLREVSVKEERPEKPRTAKYPHSKEVFGLWGDYPPHWDSQREVRQREAAEHIYQELGLEEIKNCIEFLEKHEREEFCPKIHSPYDLREKYKKLEAYSNKHD